MPPGDCFTDNRHNRIVNMVSFRDHGVTCRLLEFRRAQMSTITAVSEDLTARRQKRAWRSIRSMLRITTSFAAGSPRSLALCDQGVISFTNFGTALIVGRACGSTELGVYALAMTLISFATDTSAALITTPYTVFSPQLSPVRRRQYLGSLLAFQSILSSLFALALVVGGAVASWRGLLPDRVSGVVTTTAAVTAFVSLREFVRRVSFAEAKIASALAVDLCTCLIQVGGVLLLLRWGALTASHACIVLGISSATAAGCWIAIRHNALRIAPRCWGRDLKRDWGFAKWVLGSGLLWAVAMYLYPWMLAAFHGTSTTSPGQPALRSQRWGTLSCRALVTTSARTSQSCTPPQEPVPCGDVCTARVSSLWCCSCP